MHCMMDKKATTLLKNHDENKTYILVKLSESFSNAIQEYSAPTIKFHGPRGAVRFPNGKSYDFSLEQIDNSVECIKQTNSNTRWESVGKIACCLHVKGKDDVYQRTRTKMEAAEQEKRRYCTKLLGSSDENNTNNSSSSGSGGGGGGGGTGTGNRYNNNKSSYADDKQLKKYKADFDKDFQEYQNLHGYLHRIEERFRKLRELLEQSVEGSPEWESAKEQIFNEYERVKGDNNFHRSRSKYKQLYKKLAHIKEKIFQCKKQKRNNNCNNNDNNNKKLKR